MPTTHEIQGMAVAEGFRYWRGPDAHGVIGTTQQAIRLLQRLIGVEVQIDDKRDDGCSECAAMLEEVLRLSPPTDEATTGGEVGG